MGKQNSSAKALLLTVLSLILFTPPTLRAENKITEKGKAPSLFETIWNSPKLYKNKDNPYIQDFSLIGRYHGQYWVSDSDGNRENDWENRRFYFGFNARLFRQFTVELQMNANENFDPFYKNLYDAFIKWQPPETKFEISVGRLDYVYTGMERSTSSKKIATMERALLVNQIMPGEVVGVYSKGKEGDLSYQAGLFSGSIEDEFTQFDGGFGALIGVAYTAPLFYKSGTLHLDYLYNDGDPANNAFKPYENILTLWHRGQSGPAAMGIDLTFADGTDGISDLFGLTLLPTYDFAHNIFISNDMLQLALRYHFASSSDDHGINLAKRYEQEVATGEGDSYNSFYAGLNYYLYGNKMKLMAGLEYWDMDNIGDGSSTDSSEVKTSANGWTFISGIRLYF
ncbi:MAG: hypothetical protein JRC87_07065 [Deltaproteobacteria bacterium]|nr:hypothetical protein [Deltaproteobacteria bacterium]